MGNAVGNAEGNEASSTTDAGDGEPEVEAMAHVWASIGEVCTGLSDEEWDRATDCPGWTVRDQLSHLIGIEELVQGKPMPEVDLPDDLPHVHNDIGRLNEVPVHARRGRPGDEVLAELGTMADERLGQLRALTPEQLEETSTTILGTMPMRQFLAMRVTDAWTHEQDLRRALGRPGGFDGPGADITLGRLSGGLGYVVGKRAGAPDGTTVVVDVDGYRTLAVTVEGGRGGLADEVPDDPDVTLAMDAETFLCLATGRVDPAEAEVEVEGDAALGQRVLDGLNVMF